MTMKHDTSGLRQGIEVLDRKDTALLVPGGVSALTVAFSVVLALVAWVIWPYTGNTLGSEEIFIMLQTDLLVGLISLDVLMLFIGPASILMYIALYRTLKPISPSLALLALALNIMGLGLMIVCRPLVELVNLSKQFSSAMDVVEQARLLAAGQVFLAQMDGIAWLAQTALLMLAGLLNFTLMFRTAYYRRGTAWTGLICAAGGVGFWLPIIGQLFLLFNTLTTIPLCILIALDLFRLKKTLIMR
ncbi:MAG: hypothetical protein KKI09_07025 [Spirochaetes bacterium]|nr:hypothetical protein [Spirochaetota bacterium]MBU0955162.1 hypothetical protein [Spirochaetota bacterium]